MQMIVVEQSTLIKVMVILYLQNSKTTMETILVVQYLFKQVMVPLQTPVLLVIMQEFMVVHYTLIIVPVFLIIVL